MPMIEFYKRTLKQGRMKKIKSFEKGSWMRVIAPTSEELESLSKTYSLDTKTLHDSQDEDEYPRIESEGKTTYIIINVPTVYKGSITTLPFTVIVTETGIITISKTDLAVTRGIISSKNTYTTQKVKFMLDIFHRTSHMYDEYLHKISRDIRAKRKRLTNLSDDDIVRLVEHEEILNEFLSSFTPTVRVMKKILDGRTLTLFKDDKELIEDLLINAEQTLDICKIDLKTITNVRQAYSAVLSNNLNQRLKFLTVVTIAFTIPTIIASLFGMNVRLPMQDNPYSFLLVLVLSIGVLGMFLLVLKARKWI